MLQKKNVWSLLHSSALTKIVMKQTATNLSLKCREGFGSMHKLLTGFHFCKKETNRQMNCSQSVL